jgi:hypothetical protein
MLLFNLIELTKMGMPVSFAKTLPPIPTHSLPLVKPTFWSARKRKSNSMFTHYCRFETREPVFEIKPTKVDRKENKRPTKPTAKPPPKPKKGGKRLFAFFSS